MHANPMTYNAETATTHLGWRQSGGDAADADHLLIRSDWGDQTANDGEPILRFQAVEGTVETSNTDADTDTADGSNANATELDAEVNDAAVDAPPYLWGGDALVPDSVSGPSETVFS